jgi:glycine/D-amino acid oxidase-like deaminating enzyme
MTFDDVDTSDDAPDIRRLTFDLDVEVGVIGGGLAGLLTAIEAAQLGASVAVLESRRIGWGASGHHLGTVMPGFDVDPHAVIARIGRRAAADLWRMSQTGAEIVRAHAAKMPQIALIEGGLKVAAGKGGIRALEDELALGADFGIAGEMWDRPRVRAELGAARYFAALYLPDAFQIDPSAYLRGLVALARQLGVRIFEATPVVAMDVAGTRKRLTTPSALLRATHIVLAGNVHLGTALPRLTKTLLPVRRFGALTEPLGARAREVVRFSGSVIDTDAVDHFRLVGDRLMWSSPQTTWETQPARFAGAVKRRIRTVFPALADVKIAETFGGAVGSTVHGMPQIGQIRPGVWVASGFGRQGLNTSAMAGRVIARGILHADDRWRLFGPFDLIWAGGRAGQVAGFGIEWAARRRAAVSAAWARRSEAIVAQREVREARLQAATQRAQALPVLSAPSAPDLEAAPPHLPSAEIGSPRATLPPSPFLDVPQADPGFHDPGSHESERENPSLA